jgi:HEXXH motif-containing protein
MSLLDAAAIRRLQTEFRRSMRTLLIGLCRDIERHYGELADRLDLPVGYFRFLADSFDLASYSHWKVVGWIESLNDLVYFLDLLAQLCHQGGDQDFAEQLLVECREQFFENSYLDELFPHGRAQARALPRRLQSLCMRLALDISQESLFFDPRWTLQWIRRQGRRSWSVAGRLEPSFERAEAAYTVPIGIRGSALLVPASVRRAIRGPSRRVSFVLTDNEIALNIGRSFVPLCSRRGGAIQWHWQRREPVEAARSGNGPVTVGPTLHYGKDRQPKTLSATTPDQIARISRAWQAIRSAWPEGHALLELLTSRVVPLNASGVVSFSYRHRPGLSFVNCFDRDNLDLIDDLIHENSHHQLNLLLRKHVFHHHDRNQQIFYSPWRRRLRPLRGILHASFTFTMGALLFARLSAWAETTDGHAGWREAGLTARHLLKTRFRCLEEIESVRYALRDLEFAGRHLKWMTASGGRLVKHLEKAIMQAEHQITRYRRHVLASSFGPSLRGHIADLRNARLTYGPMTPK